jgi:hypothetical protein
MNDVITPWVLKYAPTKLEDMILTDELHETFQEWIKNKSLNNVTFYGLTSRLRSLSLYIIYR